MGIVLAVVAAALAGIAGLAYRKPDEFRVQRRTTVHAAPDAVFSRIVDLRQWNAWSPWEALDPAMRKTFSGATSGPGASYAWEGNRKVGAGRMEIAEVVEPTRVTINLEFLKPFKANNVTTFDLTPRGDATEVTWSMLGTNQFISKVMSVFMNMDAMIGKDFEKGLEALKKVVERETDAGEPRPT